MARITRNLAGFFCRFLFAPHKPPADLGPHYKSSRRIFVRAPGY